jgi:small subunit ribosomal protein S18
MSTRQKKECPFKAEGITSIDYKDIVTLKKYLTKFNKIVPRYYSGVSLKMQKELARAIKRARYMSLLPYVIDYRGPAIAGSMPIEMPEVVMTPAAE